MKKKMAEEKAKNLVDVLGKGWEPVVWNNLGWCYSAKKGLMEVCDNSIADSTSYTCYFNIPGNQFISDGIDPVHAVNSCLVKVKQYLSMVEDEVQKIVE